MEPDQQDGRDLAGRLGGPDTETAAVSLSNFSSTGDDDPVGDRSSASTNPLLPKSEDANLQDQASASAVEDQGEPLRGKTEKKPPPKARQAAADEEESQERPTKKRAPSHRQPTPRSDPGDSSNEEEEEPFTHLTTVSGQMTENPHFTIQEAKAAAKREYNRQNASRSRVRRKQKMAKLEKRCATFKKRVDELTRENQVLRGQLSFFQDQQQQRLLAATSMAAPVASVQPSSATSTQLLLARAAEQQGLGLGAAGALTMDSVGAGQLQQQLQQGQVASSSLITNPYAANSSNLLRAQAPLALSLPQQQQLALLQRLQFDQQQQQQSQQQLQGLVGGTSVASAATVNAVAAATATQHPPNIPADTSHQAAFLASFMGGGEGGEEESKTGPGGGS